MTKKLIRQVNIQLDADIPGIRLTDGDNIIRNLTHTSLWRLQNLLGKPTETWATILIDQPSIRLTWHIIYSEDQS